MYLDNANGRTTLFVTLLLVLLLVGDGPPTKLSSPLCLQLLLLPITAFFLVLVAAFLGFSQALLSFRTRAWFASKASLLRLAFIFEIVFVCIYLYETRHFADLGYRLYLLPVFVVFPLAVAGLGYAALFPERLTPWITMAVMLGVYLGGSILAVVSFPLNYLRSDMLPVIFWASRAMIAGGNPYQTFHVADRLYDFPYLPGMLLVFAPAQAFHLDLRWATMSYVVAGMLLVFWTTLPAHRMVVAALIGLFVLNPYLQYRHDLYTQGHFFSLIVVFVLMQRRQFAWSSAAFGASMVISQFSWVIFPFFLMNALRRSGWKEVGRMALLASTTAGLLIAPFLSSAAGRIAHNSVGQWDNLAHAIARPINLAFWASYVVRPNHLKWIQLVLLTGIFCFCWTKDRCCDLADTLRWMIAALTVFILFNVLIDGYFYLMLLVPMLIYTCVANGWWSPSAGQGSSNHVKLEL